MRLRYGACLISVIMPQVLVAILALSSVASALSCRGVLAQPASAAAGGSLEIQSFAHGLKAYLETSFGAVLKVSPEDVLKTHQIRADQIFDLGERSATGAEIDFLGLFVKAVESNTLEQRVNEFLNFLTSPENVVSSLEQVQALKTLPANKRAILIQTLSGVIKAELGLRGMTGATRGITYTEWNLLSKTMTRKIDQSVGGDEHALDFAKTEWTSFDQVEVLVDGKASFTKRDELMFAAKKSIDILTWSIYDDLTGAQVVDLLIQKKSAGIQVRVIVDGQVAQTPGHSVMVKKLESAGIPVIRWLSSERPFQGQHRKMIVVDGSKVIAGGLNFGDVYSHKNPDTHVPRWRDTDVFLQGNVANQAVDLFAKIWNEQIDSQKLSQNLKLNRLTVELAESRLASDPSKQSISKVGLSSGRVAIIDHNPAETSGQGSTVMLTLLKRIREAQRSVDIENAYVVLFPALKLEIAQALARGVRVRVFTNSSSSVDEPIVSVPILRTAKILAQMGAEVYLKRGDTLHSKIAIIDDRYSMIMSYNLHPRSERVEGEMAVLVDSRDFTRKMAEVFESDILSEKAIRILGPDQIELPASSPESLFTLRLFFDLL